MTCPTGKQPFTQAMAQDKARRASRRYSHKTPMPVIRRDQQISKRGTI